ncbi:hypothetical protein GCM10009716_15220 [Streptomyces sodiiphilus]|uniref:ATP-binding protein n=1 Tax=Streptomyces sodiiphilus TaxID=226217 RepID=A0ABN2P1H4_9ACTN
MVGERRPIFERRAAIEAVRKLTEPSWPARPGERRPVVVFEGTRGSGKSVLLDVLAGKLDQFVPYGRADFADPRHEDVAYTLSMAAGRMARHRPRYRRLTFPRLLIGLLVMEQDLAHLNWEDARKAVTALLKERRGRAWPVRALGSVAGQASVTGELASGGTTTVFRVPLKLLAELGVASLPEGAQRWYGHRDRGLTDRAVDTLIELNTAARAARDEEADTASGRAARDRVGGLLCEAFLADLRDCPRRVWKLPTPVLLLDNVDTPAGRSFLRRFLDARPLLGADQHAEPLTVVATGEEDLSVTFETEAVPLEGLLSVEAGAGAVEGTPVWLSYPLPDFTRANVQDLLAGASGGTDRRTARIIHGFTAGHPESAGLLAGLAARNPLPEGGIAGLLALSLPDSAGSPDEPTVQEWLLRRLAVAADGRAGDSKLAAFASCSAARNESDGLWLSHQSDLVNPAWAEAVREAGLWDDSARAAVLRRLLLYRLAGRAPDDPAGWTAVHARLRGRCRENGDRDGELYHRLAGDELEAAAEEVARLLPELPAEAWLELLDTVAGAPCGVPERHLLSPYARLQAATSSLPPDGLGGASAQVAQLVAALRVVRDPGAGVEREFLCTQVAVLLGALAPLSPDGLVALNREAAEFKRQATWWT